MEEKENPKSEKPKKSRHRKKHLYNTILQQMEFYFSDSNLTKDRFLSQLLAKDSYVDIEVFLKFNKIKKLNCTVEDIQKALKKSELIKLSEDGKKLSRSRPIDNKNYDLSTIYVENIKPDASHDDLIQIFSDFGKVTYVSIPKYKHNRANKGFAFIEFSTETEAKNAIVYFEKIGCKISGGKSPNDLLSVVTFGKDDDNEEEFKSEKNVEGHNKNEGLVTEERVETNLKKNDVIKKSANKRLAEDEVEHCQAKKVKVKNNTGEPDSVTIKLENGESIKLEEPEVKENVETEQKPAEETTEKKKAKTASNEISEENNGKKKKKEKKRKTFMKELGLQVLSKSEWKSLRNHYLNMQRKKMSEFKQYLRKQKINQQSEQKNMEENSENTETQNFATSLDFVPGIIVKMKLLEACEDVKKMKKDIKQVSPEIKYVDVPNVGCDTVYIRFSSSEAAKEFSTKDDYMGEKNILNDEEESSYWGRIKSDRVEAFQKTATKKQRGRDKLLKRAKKAVAGQHIKFDENE